MTPPANWRDKSYLADLVWLRHGRNPIEVWAQGLLIVAHFSDGTTAVHRLEELEREL